MSPINQRALHRMKIAIHLWTGSRRTPSYPTGGCLIMQYRSFHATDRTCALFILFVIGIMFYLNALRRGLRYIKFIVLGILNLKWIRSEWAEYLTENHWGYSVYFMYETRVIEINFRLFEKKQYYWREGIQFNYLSINWNIARYEFYMIGLFNE